MTLVLLLAACASCSRPPTQPVDAGVDGLDARLADRADLAPPAAQEPFCQRMARLGRVRLASGRPDIGWVGVSPDEQLVALSGSGMSVHDLASGKADHPVTSAHHFIWTGPRELSIDGAKHDVPHSVTFVRYDARFRSTLEIHGSACSVGSPFDAPPGLYATVNGKCDQSQARFRAPDGTWRNVGRPGDVTISVGPDTVLVTSANACSRPSLVVLSAGAATQLPYDIDWRRMYYRITPDGRLLAAGCGKRPALYAIDSSGMRRVNTGFDICIGSSCDLSAVDGSIDIKPTLANNVEVLMRRGFLSGDLVVVGIRDGRGAERIAPFSVTHAAFGPNRRYVLYQRYTRDELHVYDRARRSDRLIAHGSFQLLWPQAQTAPRTPHAVLPHSTGSVYTLARADMEHATLEPIEGPRFREPLGLRTPHYLASGNILAIGEGADPAAPRKMEAWIVEGSAKRARLLERADSIFDLPLRECAIAVERDGVVELVYVR
ncbi:MAG: hypothetical protein KC503_21935 [Myxococcales bacterium]|nr:hypothetical protein [Myxococcales bacterium]